MTRDKMPALVIAGSIVVGAIFLVGVPLASLIYALALLACPLMMIFMMRGMGHGSGQRGHGAGCHGGHQPTEDDVQQTSSARRATDSRR